MVEHINNNRDWDVFISHASEDKATIVEPLAQALEGFGARVWYDRFTLNYGDSLARAIDLGLANSSFGVVVLSRAFLAKRWTEHELRGLVSSEIGGRTKIIPIWHGITQGEVLEFSPPLADKLAIKSDGLSPVQIALELLRVVRPDLTSRVHLRLALLVARSKATKKRIPIKKIARPSIQHAQLPEQLLSSIRLIRAALLPVYPLAMDDWVDGFKRDTYPSVEICVWEWIASVYLEITSIVTLSSEEHKDVFALLLGLTSGGEEPYLSKLRKTLGIERFRILHDCVMAKKPAYDVPHERQVLEDNEMKARPLWRDGEKEIFPRDIPPELMHTLLAVIQKQEL